MPRYLISFNYGVMQVSEAELPAVAAAARAVVSEAYAAGVLVFAGGVGDPAETFVVARDGAVTDQPDRTRREFIGGVTVVNVPDREEALQWAARIAAACRCPQEVRPFMPDPTVERLLFGG